MTPQELRLGNFVAPRQIINFKEAAQGFIQYVHGARAHLPIRAINSDGVTVEASFHGGLFRQDVTIEDIVPVPLTEELLLKCGFCLNFFMPSYRLSLYLERFNRVNTLQYYRLFSVYANFNRKYFVFLNESD